MFHFYTPQKNVSKPVAFWRFQGVYKWNYFNIVGITLTILGITLSIL